MEVSVEGIRLHGGAAAARRGVRRRRSPSSDEAHPPALMSAGVRAFWS